MATWQVGEEHRSHSDVPEQALQLAQQEIPADQQEDRMEDL